MSNLDKFPWFYIRKRIDQDLRPQDLVRMNRPVVLKDPVLQLDHVVEGRAHNLPEQRVLVVQLWGFAHREEKLEVKNTKDY